MKKIGIDTNILIRLLVDDDPSQRAAVQKFGRGLNRDFKGYVTLVTIMEVYWALSSQYRYTRGQTLAALRKITWLRGVEIERHDQLVTVLHLAETKNTDFADELIAVCALADGCDHIATFDQKAARRISGMELLS